MNLLGLFIMASAFGSAIASPALAALTGPSPQTVPVQVVLLQDKDASKVSVTAPTADSSGILRRSCSKSLSTGLFNNHHCSTSITRVRATSRLAPIPSPFTAALTPQGPLSAIASTATSTRSSAACLPSPPPAHWPLPLPTTRISPSASLTAASASRAFYSFPPRNRR